MPTETELKKLNRNVEDALNIIKMYIGTSGQLKAMNEKQRAIIEKWSNVTDETGETQKRQRAFTERERDAQGRFIKKQDNQAKRFMGIASSIKGIFMGMAKGITTSIGNFAKGISSHFSNFFQAVKNQFLGLFGEESEWFEILGSIKDSLTGFIGSIGRGFLMIFRRTPVWAKNMVNVLKDMYRLQIKQMKRDLLDGTGDKKGKTGVFAMLGVILFAIAAGIGAWLHRKLIAFKLFSTFGKLGKFFARLEKFPLLGKVIKGLKFGFRWLGLPLTILLSVIDFIKAFTEEQGTLWEKIKEGLFAVFAGFIELPVQFIGFLIEKVAGLFGVELEDISKKMMDGLKTGFMFLLDLPIKISMVIKEAVTNVIQEIKSWKDPLMNAISPIILGVHNFFVEFWNSMVKWMVSKIPSWLPGAEKIAKGLQVMQLTRMNVPDTSPSEKIAQNEKMAIEQRKKSEKELAKVMSGFGKSMDANNRSTGTAINALTNMQANQVGTGGTGEPSQIPDEVDNYGMVMFNYAGGMS